MDSWQAYPNSRMNPVGARFGTRNAASRIPRNPSYRFRRRVAAAHRSLHGCGPAGRGPVSRQEHARPNGLRMGTIRVYSRLRPNRWRELL